MDHFLLMIRLLLLASGGSVLGRTAAFQGAKSRFFSCSRHLHASLSSETSDVDFMNLAIAHAKHGLGHTFPNPAVGCVLVRQDTQDVIGSGFHPRAGFPHAEVFALLEACGHVPNGVDAAMAVLDGKECDLLETVYDLSEKYVEEGGAEELFGETFASMPVTAYVTLEPCCHFGKTPPCASTLVLSKVDRVVVGFRDPNPRVDGGGVRLLEEAGIPVDYADDIQAEECGKLVTNFVKRITQPEHDYSTMITGAMRRALRSLAGRRKTENTLLVRAWPSTEPMISTTIEDDFIAAVETLPLDPTWLEEVDSSLWENELVLLRLNKAVGKKKGAKLLGQRIALELDAHLAQVIGHTALLYRPGCPPVLDLAQLVEEQKTKAE